MYSADADGRGRTRTFIYFFTLKKKTILFFYFFAYIDLRAQLERDPESDRLGHPPPPHASWSHKDTYSLPVKPVIYFVLDFAMYTVYTRGGGGGGEGGTPYIFHICAARMPLFLTIFLSLAT